MQQIVCRRDLKGYLSISTLVLNLNTVWPFGALYLSHHLFGPFGHTRSVLLAVSIYIGTCYIHIRTVMFLNGL